MANQIKWNGALLGLAFGLVALWAIKGAQNLITPNFANTVYGWFTSMGTWVAANVSFLSSLSPMALAFSIAGLMGLIIGLIVEYK